MSSEPRSQIKGKDLLQGALILTTALAWNETAKKFIEYVLPIDESGKRKHKFQMTIIYALFVTMIIVLVIITYNYVNAKVNINTSNYSTKNVIHIEARPRTGSNAVGSNINDQ